LTAYIGLMT